MENQNSKKVVIGVVVLALVALLAGWWLLQNGSGGPAAVGTVDNSTTPAVDNSGATVTVNDQFPGSIIFISDVSLPHTGWVVIRQNNNGQLGSIVGAGYFDDQTHVGEVDLSSPTLEGQSYFAVLYSDSGDKRFSLGADKPINGKDGQPIQVLFNITRDLPERKG